MKERNQPPVIEIRKYSNRRLYDKSASSYVTLSDVAQMIRDNKEIRVVDAKTGEDLTRTVMLQIICESKLEQEALPIGFLRQVISASSDAVRTSIKDFLTAGISAQKEVHVQMANWMRLGMMANPLTAPLVTVWQQLNRGQKAGDLPQAPVSPEGGMGHVAASGLPGGSPLMHGMQGMPMAPLDQEHPFPSNGGPAGPFSPAGEDRPRPVEAEEREGVQAAGEAPAAEQSGPPSDIRQLQEQLALLQEQIEALRQR